MDSLYPAGPAAVPADLTRPSKTYKRQAWLAMIMLAVFVLLYLSLSGWFAWTAWRLLVTALDGGKESFLGGFVSACAAFLAVFMLKALFFIERGGKISDVEITATEQPRLFAFLHRLADEAGAPRPHRVFLSARVNAAVFYDLSILNLIFPSRKNLEIGLGLVNVLNVGEFKAVCAHEFGHFAQRSMAVGRWVYIAQQIAGHIIGRRDALDHFLEGLSRVDLRIAWIGWLLRIVVWALRSLLDGAFALVVLAQRSLSREMEMQADRVSVSLTGSDALIHALYRLQVADDAWDRTLNFLGNEAANKRVPSDAFQLQSHIIARMRELLNVSGYGLEPPRPTGDPAQHRLFKAEIAQPPRMWCTHPLNHEREENAKSIYLPAEGDARSAWDLFDDVDALRTKVSARLITDAEAQSVPSEEAISRLDEQFGREYLNPAYRGAYYGRSPVRAAATVAALYDPLDGAEANLDALYPESLSTELGQAANLEKEIALLESLRDGRLTAPGGVIRHRDATFKLRALPQAIQGVQCELQVLQEKISAHDRLCRTAHRAAAARIGNGWEDYLCGLAAVLHYADHGEASVRDAQRRFNNVVALATAARRVNAKGRKRIVLEAQALFRLLSEIYCQSGSVVLSPALLAGMEIGNWSGAIGELGLLGPTFENIGEWFKVYEGWVDRLSNALLALRRHALEELLLAEGKVAAAARVSTAPDANTEPRLELAPQASGVPAQYPVLLPGQEYKLSTQLDWWARFQTANGLFPALARFAVAATIIGMVLMLGGTVGTAKITVLNGLDRNVRVDVGEYHILVNAHDFRTLEVPPNAHYRVVTHTAEGQEIEAFDEDLDSYAMHIYNVASANPMVEWTAIYGNAKPRPNRVLGTPRWSTTRADAIFVEPPRQISTDGGGGTRVVLSTPQSDTTPEQAMQLVTSEVERKTAVMAHARWDGAHTPYLVHWLSMAAEMGPLADIVTARLHDDPNEVIARRLEQDAASNPAEHSRLCARNTELSRAQPDNSDLQYLAVRCLENKAAQSQAFVEAHRKWPKNAWLANAAGYALAENRRWSEALVAWTVARAAEPALINTVSIDMARLLRLQSGDKVELKDLVAGSTTLTQVLELEQGDPGDDAVRKAYRELASGNLEPVTQLSKDTSAQAYLLRLAASSDGAGSDTITQALSLSPDRGLDDNTLPCMLALAARMKSDTSGFEDRLRRTRPETAETLLNFLKLAQTGKVDEADKTLIGLDPRVLGQAWSMGVIVLGKQAPQAWREGAKRLLFVSERPWFA